MHRIQAWWWFGSIDCGLRIDNPTCHGALMFVHCIEAPETGVRAGGRQKYIGPVLGLQNIKWCCSFISKSSYTIAQFELAAVAVTQAISVGPA